MSLQYCEIIIVEGWFDLDLGLWCLMPLSTIFQLYRSVLLVEETGLSHNVVLSTPRPSGIRIHNVSGDRHRLHR